MDASEKTGKDAGAAHWSPAPAAASRGDTYGWTQEDPESTSFLFATILRLCRSAGGSRVLDLGCGNGSVAGRLQAAGFDVTGVDADAAGLTIASARFPAVRFLAADLARPAREQGLADFDLVVSTEVVEHLYLPRQLPKLAMDALRPGGHLLVSTPYHGYWKNLALSLLDKWDKHHTVFWDGGHIKFWSRQTLTRLLEEAGFRVRSFHGVGRMPFLWKSMVLLAQKPS